MQVVLVGQSMGGFTNLELMEGFPEKIALAIFVAAPVTPSGVAYGESPVFDMVRLRLPAMFSEICSSSLHLRHVLCVFYN